MKKNKKIWAGIIAITAIVSVSVFAIHSVNKTFKNINFNEIDWDI